MANLLSELEMAMWRIDKMDADYARMMSVGFLRENHAEIAADAKDAARYRWLLEHAGSIRSGFWYWQKHSGASVEKLIDAAMSAREGLG